MQGLPFITKYKRLLIPLILVLITLLLQRVSGFVNYLYPNYVFSPVTKLLRAALGGIAFSLGDVLYAIIFLYLLYTILISLYKLIKRQYTKQVLYQKFTTLTSMALWLVVLFKILWGFNYYKQPLATTLKLPVTTYNKEDVLMLSNHCLAIINTIIPQITNDSNFALSAVKPYLQAGYDSIATQIPALQYSYNSVKPALYSKLQGYMGFQGYYNPLTGEAQVSTDVPLYMQPSIALHEMAHQIGIGYEDEANLVAYLAAYHNTNPYIRYSSNVDMLQYSLQALVRLDTTAYKQIIVQVPLKVKTHIRQYYRYLGYRQGVLSNTMSSTYNTFMQANNMPKGLNTYNEVVGLAIAFIKKK